MAETQSGLSQPPESDAGVKSAAPPFPIIDFSALISDNSGLRSNALNHLLNACQDWGFFFLVNHGISEVQMKATFAVVKEFHSLPEDEKNGYKKDINNVKYGADDFVYTSVQPPYMWRNSFFLRFRDDYPQFPDKPYQFKEVVSGYGEAIRGLGKRLVEAVTDALELDRQYVQEILKLDSSFPIMAGNLYPPCSQPEETFGAPPHTDIGFFNFIVRSEFSGLQIERDGQWIDVVDPLQPNSIFVNVADQIEVFSNGRCKSVLHKVAVDSEKEVMSIVVGFGPPREATVGPAAALVEKDGLALYGVTKYGDYVATKYLEHPTSCR